MRCLRTAFQIVVIVAVLVTGLRFAMGWSRTSIETYCPFGGLEAALSLFTQQTFTCATGERNLAMFVALILLTLIARKSFCSWVCPVGAVSEWFAALGRKLFPQRRRDDDRAPLHALEPPRRWDRRLRWLRLPVLAAILYFTFRTGELIFRGFDPYYILFSFHGHDVKTWSYLVLGFVLAGVIVIPMAWCRYLCPLGVALWPFSLVGRFRLARNDAVCTGCHACDRVCPQGIVVSRGAEVRSGECTLCFECTEVCPEGQALELKLRGIGA
jgi:polyferredoxin